MHDNTNARELNRRDRLRAPLVVQYLVHLFKDGSYVHRYHRVRGVYGSSHIGHPCNFQGSIVVDITS